MKKIADQVVYLITLEVAAFVHTLLLTSIESLPCLPPSIRIVVGFFLSINGSGVRQPENCIQTATSQTADGRDYISVANPYITEESSFLVQDFATRDFQGYDC